MDTDYAVRLLQETFNRVQGHVLHGRGRIALSKQLVEVWGEVGALCDRMFLQRHDYDECHT